METKGPDTPEAWNAASKGYAADIAPLMVEAYAGEFCDRLDVGAEHTAIELAAGSGALTAVLASRAKSVLATDFSPSMVEILKERMKDAEHVRVELMDGQKLTVESDTFDRGACCFGLMLFPNRAQGFSELCRVVKPGGIAMVSGWGGPERFEAFALFLSALQRAVPDMPPPATPPPVFSLSALGTIKSEMEAAGFVDVETDYVTRELELPGMEDLWLMMTSGAPAAQMLFDRIGESGKQKVEEALAGIVEERFGGGPIRVTNSATVGTGRVPS
jgi:SAM-dependent methyltransferase